jgi:hypothetical protein
VVVLAGIPIFSVIAVSLGVFACDPLAQDVRTKVKPSFVYLYMMLSGVYVYAVTSEVWAQKAVLIVLMAAFAVALWQKSRDQLPYLLDPSMTPPARVSTADGLIAAMLFFVLQGMVMLALVGWEKMAASEAIVIAFGLAGIVVYCVMRLAFMLTKTRDVPAMLGASATRALAWGAGGGAAAALCGIVYLYGLRTTGWVEDAAMPRFDPRWLAAGRDRGPAMRGIHFPRLDLRRHAALARSAAEHSDECSAVRNHASTGVDGARVRARGDHGLRV